MFKELAPIEPTLEHNNLEKPTKETRTYAEEFPPLIIKAAPERGLKLTSRRHQEPTRLHRDATLARW